MKRRTLFVMLVALLALAGCSSLPRSGEVHAVNPTPNAVSEVGLVAQPPVKDAGPEEIVQGFLDASAAGLGDDFAVARQFLSGSAAADWKPLAQVQVYPDTQNIQRSRTDTGAIHVSVGALGTLSADGVFTESPNDATAATDFSLAKNADGQWRIVSLNDGIFLSEHLLGVFYTRAPLYFLSADGNGLVADLRWYPKKSFATSAVRGLLAGPSQWLEGGVSSAFPDGTELTNAGVTVTDGVAHVDLSSQVMAAQEQQRSQMLAQLRRTLLAVSSINEVSVTVEGASLPSDRVPDLVVYPYGSYPLSVIADGLPATVQDNEAVPAIANPEVAALGLTNLAVGYQDSGSTYAALATNRTQLFWLDTQNADWRILATGTSLIGPSFDIFGWVFTDEVDNHGTLTAYNPQSSPDPVVLSVPWLQGAQVRDIAVSRDGSRIALVAKVGGDVRTYVAAISRTAEGFPTAIGDPARVGQRLSDVTDISWITPTSLVALGTSAAGSDSGLFQVTIGGPMDKVTTPYSGTIAITAGRDEQSIMALTGLGTVVGMTGRTWNTVVEGVTAAAYPG